MTEDQSRLGLLLQRYLAKTATDAETAELNALIHNSDKTEIENLLAELMNTADPEFDPARTEMILQGILKYQPATVLPMGRRWYKVAAAAAVIVLASTAVFYYTLRQTQVDKPDALRQAQREPTPLNDVTPPNTVNAILTLSNGQQIILDSAGNGTLALQAGANVVKEGEGVISYQQTAGSHQASAINPQPVVYNTLTNPRGSKVITMKLADGSQVWLNAGSSVKFPVAFVGSERKVDITGEVYFEVVHDAAKPFKVSKGTMEVMVLGTHFNVKAYEEESDIKVTLLEGSVRTAIGNGQSAVLKPGQQATLRQVQDGRPAHIEAVNEVNLEQVMAWKNGKFQFGEKANIETIMREISRWYNVDVEYKGTITEHFGGSISRNVNLSEVLNVLKTTGGVRFNVEGNKVVVMPPSGSSG